MLFKRMTKKELEKKVFEIRLVLSVVNDPIDGEESRTVLIDDFEVAIGPEQIKEAAGFHYENLLHWIETRLDYVFKEEEVE